MNSVVNLKTKEKIFQKIKTIGMPVRRGVRDLRYNQPYSHDPGDFGRGIYYDTNYYRALSYGTVTKSIIFFENPIILTSKEAYDLAEIFKTIKLSESDIRIILQNNERTKCSDIINEQRLKNAQKMTEHMLSNGYDGLVSINRFGLEIVDYRPYRKG